VSGFPRGPAGGPVSEVFLETRMGVGESSHRLTRRVTGQTLASVEVQSQTSPPSLVPLAPPLLPGLLPAPAGGALVGAYLLDMV
jgi:hypothetical protein